MRSIFNTRQRSSLPRHHVFHVKIKIDGERILFDVLAANARKACEIAQSLAMDLMSNQAINRGFVVAVRPA